MCSERRPSASQAALWMLRTALALGLLARVVAAEDASEAPLTTTPSTCVTLHRGQVCYLEVRLSWLVPGPGEWCIERDDGRRLVCWRGQERRAHVHEYASASAERYHLVRVADAAILASAEIRTAWVYRSGRRSSSGWRLF